MHLNRDMFTLEHDGQVILLTRCEFAIVNTLAHRPGIVRTRSELTDLISEVGSDRDDRSIDSHVRRMRAKGVAPIKTRWGFGYYWKDAPGRGSAPHPSATTATKGNRDG